MKKFLLKIFPKKGSALIFAMITLTAMMIVAIASYEASMVNQRTATDTEKSVSSFQAADSGVEILMQIINKEIKDGNANNFISSLSTIPEFNTTSCVYSGYVSGRKIEVGLYTDSNATEASRANCATHKISDIASIKSVGSYGGTTRAVSVAVAATASIPYDIECVRYGTDNMQCFRMIRATGDVPVNYSRRNNNQGQNGSWVNMQNSPFPNPQTNGDYIIRCIGKADSSAIICIRMNTDTGSTFSVETTNPGGATVTWTAIPSEPFSAGTSLGKSGYDLDCTRSSGNNIYCLRIKTSDGTVTHARSGNWGDNWVKGVNGDTTYASPW